MLALYTVARMGVLTRMVHLRFSDFVAFDSLIRRNFEPHELVGIESLPQRRGTGMPPPRR